MPRSNHILNLPGFSIRKTTGTNPLILDVVYCHVVRCIYCNSKKLRKKASFIRKVRHESIGHRQTILRFKAHKFYCNDCHRYFNQRFPGINKNQRATEHLRKEVFYQHTKGVSQKDLARQFKLGKATIERWYHKHYELAFKEIEQKECPHVLGIDEHFFSKKEGYATTFCNLRKHKIFDVVKGRSEKELASYLEKLPGKEKVKVICIDLSSTYRSLIQKYFPKAKIVADRFHVVRLMMQLCMQTYQEIDPGIKNNRGLLAALRTHPDNLSLKRQAKRDAYFKEQPAVEAIYRFKRLLHRLLMKKTVPARRCKKLIPLFLNLVKGLK